MNKEIINSLLNFSLVGLIFVLVLFITLKIFLKKFKFDKKNIELYGIFLQLKTTSLISIAALTINYLFLVWATASFKGLNIIYITFTLILVLISDIVIDKFNNIPRHLLQIIGSSLTIELVYLIYNYLNTEYNSPILFIVLLLVIIFAFLYYTYNLFKNINNVVIDQKYLKRKKYKI